MAIELINAEKTYGDIYAVKDLTMTIPDNQITILIGPSGCGKTTTMKMINGLIPKTNGDIKINGTSIDEWNPIQLRRNIGYIIQEIGLFPHYTIFDNIATVPRLLHWEEKKIRQRVLELMDLVNLDPDEFLQKYPSQLSGGQRQRVGVARGLAADPDIVLMDEPFGAIDPINREKIQDSFLEIQKEIQKTIVFVTHDIHEAIKLGDSIAILDEGSLVQFDSAYNVVNNPATPLVEDLLGSDRAFKGLALLRVKDHMTKTFTTLTKSVSPADALQTMKQHDTKFAFLVDGRNNKLLGVVTAKDIKKRRADSLDKLSKQSEYIQPYATLLESLTKLFSSGFTALPVIDDKNVLVGVIHMQTILDQIEEMSILETAEDEA